MKFGDIVKENYVWKFSKNDFQNFTNSDNDIMVYTGTIRDTINDVLNKVKNQDYNWLVAYVDGKLYGVSGNDLNPEKFNGKLVKY